ncbi:TetR/AcrR family transcriptional regulator [Nocardia beijingensis]|uniref:TetR/AcrR family transcriptional regulator n=1 Tax=Nocardia beijingensis TaxID=95162 RepID=A0ABW7WDL1_9NOCA
MPRPRAFDEETVVESAARLFARRGFDAVSIDDLVGELGIHRHSLYRTFGSKRGLYLRALRAARRQLRHALSADDPLRILCAAVASEEIGALDLLLMAAIEQGSADPEIAAEVRGAFAELDSCTAAPGRAGTVPTATLLGLRLRARAGEAIADFAAETTGRTVATTEGE